MDCAESHKTLTFILEGGGGVFLLFGFLALSYMRQKNAVFAQSAARLK